jgi:hypothetical protein
MKQREQQQPQQACPAAWSLYFADECKQDDRRLLLIRELAAFFATDTGWKMLSNVHMSHAAGHHVLQLDFADLHSR